MIKLSNETFQVVPFEKGNKNWIFKVCWPQMTTKVQIQGHNSKIWYNLSYETFQAVPFEKVNKKQFLRFVDLRWPQMTSIVQFQGHFSNVWWKVFFERSEILSFKSSICWTQGQGKNPKKFQGAYLLSDWIFWKVVVYK